MPLRFQDVINLWPSLRELWRDVRVDHHDLAYETVRSWRSRDSIKGAYWDSIVRAAARRGYPGVTYEALSHAASARGRDFAEPHEMAPAA